jgi:hypothetical protein
MNEYYIKVILLEGCPYSIAANNLIYTHGISGQIINVTSTNKDQFKTDIITTFPQIYLCKSNSNGTQLLGGYTDFSEFVTTFKGNRYNEEHINIFMKKYSWSKKATLRLIQLIN